MYTLFKQIIFTLFHLWTITNIIYKFIERRSWAISKDPGEIFDMSKNIDGVNFAV